MKSKGAKQRVHYVKIEGDDVLVADSSLVDDPSAAAASPPAASAAMGRAPMASDSYAFAAFNAGAKEAPKGGALPIHSSIVKGAGGAAALHLSEDG